MYLLAIETSCDDTAAAVCYNGKVISNEIFSQQKHISFGGIVPELASRMHQQYIIPIIEIALHKANITIDKLSAIAVTAGPGLLGALMVGVGVAKGLAFAQKIPLIAVDHLQGHIFSVFSCEPPPKYPFLTLIVSGGHTQIMKINSPLEYQLISKTRDDAAGEAFDKIARLLGLPYPGGPIIDKLAQNGNPFAFNFPTLQLEGIDYSFSGLKTSVRYFLQKQQQQQPDFIEQHLCDLCASIQYRIITTLIDRFFLAAQQTHIHRLAIVGGVSANSLLRNIFITKCQENKFEAFIPNFSFCTDNAGMIALAGWQLFESKIFADLSLTPYATGT
jgi:N6-L-threonylcarbamoyladenine synthase